MKLNFEIIVKKSLLNKQEDYDKEVGISLTKSPPSENFN